MISDSPAPAEQEISADLVKKIERIRSRCPMLDVVDVCDLVADQCGLDPQAVAIAHFAALIDKNDGGS